MSDSDSKTDTAFRTISEVADELGLPQHILRYWETRFTQLRPLQRAGNRRYYRPADVDLAKRINRLLNQEGYTIKGVQKLLSGKTVAEPVAAAPAPPPSPAPVSSAPSDTAAILTELRKLRDRLRHAIAADDMAARV